MASWLPEVPTSLGLSFCAAFEAAEYRHLSNLLESSQELDAELCRPPIRAYMEFWQILTPAGLSAKHCELSLFHILLKHSKEKQCLQVAAAWCAKLHASERSKLVRAAWLGSQGRNPGQGCLSRT